MTIVEAPIDYSRYREEHLRSLQDQFSTLLDVDPELLRGLELCNHCRGQDYEWTDWSQCDIDPVGLDIRSEKQAQSYRFYILDQTCKHCEGTGFEGGSFQFERDEWLSLSAGNLSKQSPPST